MEGEDSIQLSRGVLKEKENHEVATGEKKEEKTKDSEQTSLSSHVAGLPYPGAGSHASVDVDEGEGQKELYKDETRDLPTRPRVCAPTQRKSRQQRVVWTDERERRASCVSSSSSFGSPETAQPMKRTRRTTVYTLTNHVTSLSLFLDLVLDFFLPMSFLRIISRPYPPSPPPPPAGTVVGPPRGIISSSSPPPLSLPPPHPHPPLPLSS